MIKTIQSHSCKERPKCLLVGNGINKRFKDKSWEELIEEALKASGQDYSPDELENMPATMQIVAATKDHVHHYMKDLSDCLMKIEMTEERSAFLQSLLSLPVDDSLPPVRFACGRSPH